MNRLIVSLLFGVQPTDAPTLALATLTIALLLPARAGCPPGVHPDSIPMRC